jgi:hypothetical protein
MASPVDRWEATQSVGLVSSSSAELFSSDGKLGGSIPTADDNKRLELDLPQVDRLLQPYF